MLQETEAALQEVTIIPFKRNATTTSKDKRTLHITGPRHPPTRACTRCNRSIWCPRAQTTSSRWSTVSSSRPTGPHHKPTPARTSPWARGPTASSLLPSPTPTRTPNRLRFSSKQKQEALVSRRFVRLNHINGEVSNCDGPAGDVLFCVSLPHCRDFFSRTFAVICLVLSRWHCKSNNSEFYYFKKK